MPSVRRPHTRIPTSEKIKDGRIYQKSGQSRDGRTIYLRCQKQTTCQGTAKMMNGVIHELNAHSEFCMPDNREVLVARFKEAMAEALSLHWYRLKPLYDSLAAVHPEAAALKPYESVRSFMKTCRRRRFPPNPGNISQFVEELMAPGNEGLSEYDTGRLTVRLITDRNGADHALFFDENFIRDEITDVTKLLIDATFRSRPLVQGAYQLLTIMGIKLNDGFPFAWVVMSQKTQPAYIAVLQHVKEHVLTANTISLAMSDFERGLRNAISAVFSTAQSTGCNAHYDHAIYRKAKALGLGNRIQTVAEAEDFYIKILALAYLPAQLVSAQYHRLWDNLPAALKPRFDEFHRYYCRYWLRTVTPSGFSVYGRSRQTNNIIEPYHRRLRLQMESRPGPWEFVYKLLKLQSDVRADIQCLRNNGRISRHARYSTVFKQRALMIAWRELHFHEITAGEFLEKAAALKGNVAALIDLESQDGIEDNDTEDEMVEPPTQIPLEHDPDYDHQLFADERPGWLADNAEEAEELAENVPLVDDTDYEMSGHLSDESVNDIVNPTEFQQHTISIEQAAQQSPPSEHIEEIASPDVASLAPVNRANETDANTAENGEAPSRIWGPTARPTRTQRRRRASQRRADPVEPASENNRKRNRRRKLMRRRALARSRGEVAHTSTARRIGGGQNSITGR